MKPSGIIFSIVIKTLIMEKMNDLTDLLKHEIADLHSAEEQIIKALPAMIENASDSNLKKSLEKHLRITEQQFKRIDQVHKKLEGGKKQGNKGLWSRLMESKHECVGMKGILQEGEKIMNEDMDPEVKDAAIIASCQKVEHYEICGYGTAKAYAEELNLRDIALELDRTLQEEYDADLILSDLAESRINQEAEARPGSGSDDRRSAKSERVRREEREMELAAASRSNRSAGRDDSGNRRTPATSRSKGGNNSNSSTGGRTNASAGRNTSASSKSNSRRSGNSRSGNSKGRGNGRSR